MTTDLECPKCFGLGELRHFANVRGGTCFLCAGSKIVDERTASRWLAAQMRQDAPRAQTTTPNAPETKGVKWMVIAGLGEVRITRRDDGTFALLIVDATALTGSEHSHYLTAGFVVARGAVHMIPRESCNGLDGHERAIAAHLTAALRVSA